MEMSHYEDFGNLVLDAVSGTRKKGISTGFEKLDKYFHDKPGEFDPRKYLGPARDEMKKLYMHKIVNVLGSNGKAE